MKKCFLFSSVVLSALLLSCSTNESFQPGVVGETVYQQVGRMHNEGLDYVLDYIRQNRSLLVTKSGQSVSKEDIVLMIELAVKEFVRESSGSRMFYPETRLSSSNLAESDISSLRTFLDHAGNDYLDNFVSILRSDEKSDWKLIALSELVDQISDDKDIDHSSKESLLYTVEVGLSSLKYWKENVQDWYSVLNDQMITRTRSQEWINAQGTICDEYFRPQAGVSITIKGTYCGTSTDADGRYGIGVRPNDIIVITLLGYKGVNVAANEYLAGPITTVLEPNDGFPGYLLSIITADATGAGVQYYTDPRAILSAALLTSLSAAVGYLAQDIIE